MRWKVAEYQDKDKVILTAELPTNSNVCDIISLAEKIVNRNQDNYLTKYKFDPNDGDIDGSKDLLFMAYVRENTIIATFTFGMYPRWIEDNFDLFKNILFKKMYLVRCHNASAYKVTKFLCKNFGEGIALW